MAEHRWIVDLSGTDEQIGARIADIMADIEQLGVLTSCTSVAEDGSAAVAPNASPQHGRLCHLSIETLPGSVGATAPDPWCAGPAMRVANDDR